MAESSRKVTYEVWNLRGDQFDPVTSMAQRKPVWPVEESGVFWVRDEVR